jgi:DNA-directed RNA polymerase specialized sigma24 family protein
VRQVNGVVVGLLSRTEPDEWRIIDEMYPALHRFAAVTAPSDLDPDDLLQEALVMVIRRGRLSDLDHPAAYLRRTIVNAAADHYRRMGRRRVALGRYTGSVAASTTPDYPSDLADLNRLQPRDRATLYLHEVEGYPFDEIGRMLGCSEAAAKTRASRARRRLARALGAEGIA